MRAAAPEPRAGPQPAVSWQTPSQGLDFDFDLAQLLLLLPRVHMRRTRPPFTMAVLPWDQVDKDLSFSPLRVVWP